MSTIKIKSPTGSPFKEALEFEAKKFFAGKSTTGNLKLFIKTAVIIVSGLFLFFFPYFVWYGGIIYLITKALSGYVAASAGFCIGHDALHDSFSEYKKLNRLFGYIFDVYGASSFFWITKHNIIHHGKTNTPDDGDIATSGMFRFAPFQKWLPRHRFQHIYAYPAYAIEHLYWFFNDFKRFKESGYKMSFFDKVIFFSGKLLYILKTLVLPVVFFGWWGLLGFFVMEAVCGYRLSIVFQLAHVQRKSQFFEGNEKGVVEMEWAVEQVLTTADFGTKNRWLTYWLGGLNFQVIHHLFPRVSHVHYPEMQNFVVKLCNEFNLPYNHYETMKSAKKDHFGHLKDLALSSN